MRKLLVLIFLLDTFHLVGQTDSLEVLPLDSLFTLLKEEIVAIL